MLQLGSTLEVTRAKAHESDAIAMLGVHVRLNLEDKGRDFFFGRFDDAFFCLLRARRRTKSAHAIEQFANAEGLEG